MPTVRKLSPDEITTHTPAKQSTRQQNAHVYDAMLADFAPGEWAEVGLDEGDNRITVRNRLEAASLRRGLQLTFQRSANDLLRFGIHAAAPSAAPVEQPPLIASEPVPTPTPHKRGRKPAVIA